MTIPRTTLFLSLATAIIIPPLCCRLFWLQHALSAKGIYAFKGLGESGDQLPEDYSLIGFQPATGHQDTIWFHGLGNLSLSPNTPITVRYSPDNPHDARVDLFPAIWGDILVYTGIPLLMLAFAFFHPQVFPHGIFCNLSRKTRPDALFPRTDQRHAKDDRPQTPGGQ